MKTIIKNGLIITFIHEGYHAIKMKYGDIVIEDGLIAQVTEDAGAGCSQSAEIIDASGKIVMPGFVNLGSQCLAAKLLHGLIADYPRHNWQGTVNYNRVQPMLKLADEMLTFEEKCDLARWALQDAIACGSTTLVDLNRPGLADAVSQAAAELGVRAWVVSMRTAGEFPTALHDGRLLCEEPATGSFDAGLETSGPVTRMDGLYSLETTSEAMWRDVRRQAGRDGDGFPLLIHGAYSHYENQISRIRYGKSPVAVINDEGALGKRSVLLNSFHTDFFDRERLRTAGAHVSLSAVGAMQEGLTLPVVTMLRQDINTALGTGYYGVSMLDEMKQAAFGGKLETGMAQQYQASDAFYAATVAGAQAMGQALGRIEPGFHADLLIINPDRLRPLNYPLNNFVYHAQPHDIETVMVGGQVIQTPSPDQAGTTRDRALRAQRCAEKVWAKARESIL